MGFDVVMMNMVDGSVQGHKAGCADLKRGVRKFSEPFQADEVENHESKWDAFVSYNSDFIETDEDGNDDFSNCYEIQWAACAKHVPEGGPTEAPEPVETYADPEHARRNFADLASKAGTEQGRKFWQAKADAI